MPHRLGRTILLLIPLWVSVGLAADENLGPAAEYTGAHRCGRCHESALAVWHKSAHQRAHRALSEKQARDPRCVRCHGVSSPKVAGVQCESCHGAGHLYAKRYVMKDKVLSRIVGLTKVDEKSCRRCHTETAPKIRTPKFSDMIMRIAHGLDQPESNSTEK
jgi:hypothetical protein